MSHLHPASEKEIIALVQEARRLGKQVRVRGSAHSVPYAIHTDAFLRGEADGFDIVLDRLNQISVNPGTGELRAGGGARLSEDPRDRSGKCRVEDGVVWALDRAGWALPNLAGITHQTIAGFIATGSDGGSARYGLLNSITGIRFVDGRGEIHEFLRERDPDLFHATLVSLGLFGIVTEVRMQGIPRYDVTGTEETSTFSALSAGILGESDGGAAGFFRESPYARIVWWPQAGVDRATVLRSARVAPLGEPALLPAEGHVPYRQFPTVGGTDLVFQAAGSALLNGLARIPENLVRNRVRDFALRAFLPIKKTTHFNDVWWRALPMDNGVETDLFPTAFTEMWFPIERADRVISRLRELFGRRKARTGDFAIEFYAGAATEAWMSPGYRRESLRVNLYWFEKNRDDPRDTFFPDVWEALSEFDPRYHWGKILPYPSPAFRDRLAAQYPHWDRFLEHREKFDPDGIFLTDAWAMRFGLPRPREGTPFLPLSSGKFRDSSLANRSKWPAIFAQDPSDESWLETADYKFEIKARIYGDPDRAFRAVAFYDGIERWVPGGIRADWLSGSQEPTEAVVDEVFTFMTLRLRTVIFEPGRRFGAAAVSSSLPFVRSLFEMWEFSSAGEGGTDVRIRIGANVRELPLPYRRIIIPGIRAWLGRALGNLGRALEKEDRGDGEL